MHLLLLLATMLAPQGAIDATIHGTAAPLEVELLLRNDADQWIDVKQQRLPAGTRRIRFDALAAGVYQLRVRGAQPGEQLGTKVAVGANDKRRIEIRVEPFLATGRVTLGGTELGHGALTLRHRDLHWTTTIPIAADGTFRAAMWQRGAFTYHVRGDALPNDYAYELELDERPLAIDIPDGRIRGVVRDAKSGAPVFGAMVGLQTNIGEREEHTRLTTDAEGRFDFTGIKHGRHTVRVYPPRHLEPEPIVFTLGDDARLRELDIRVDAGREVAVIVIDADNDPVANAVVFTVADAKLRARTRTDEDGRTTIAVPEGEAATLFVIPEEGPFGMLRVARETQKGRLQVHLPRTSSSLRIQARTTTGRTMPPFSLLMRYNGELVPPEVAEELATVQGLQLATSDDSDAHLRNIPSGSYEFWPYRTSDEAQSIIATAGVALAPIQVNVRTGENEIAVKFASRR